MVGPPENGHCSLDAKNTDPLLDDESRDSCPELDKLFDSDDLRKPEREDTIGTQVRKTTKQTCFASPAPATPWDHRRNKLSNKAVNEVRQRLRLQVLISCIIMFTEGYYATHVFPYVAWMAADLRGNQQNVGLYSGLLYTCQSLGMLATAVMWARTSNKYGRRICLLIGLLSNVIATSVVAVSTDYWLTLSMRLLSGMLNSNLSIMRTALRESFHFEGEDDTSAFSTLSVAFGASCVAGPSMGGLLYSKALPFDIGVGWEQPWTFPILSCTVLYMLCFIITARFLPETAFLAEEVAQKGEGVLEASTEDPLKDGRFLLLLVIGGGHSYVFTGWELVYPLVARLPKTDAGEAWSTAEIGITFLFGSIGLMLFSLLCYPKIVRKVSVVRVWVYSWMMPVIIMPLFPRVLTMLCVMGFDTAGPLVKCLNYFAQLFVSVLLGSGFISIQLLLNSYVSSSRGGKATLAVANSWLVSTQAFVRAVSPMANGTLFTLGIHAEEHGHDFPTRSLPFDSIGLLGLVTCIGCALEFERRGVTGH